VILDGDKKTGGQIDPSSIPESENRYLGEKIMEVCGSNISFTTDGSKRETNESQRRKDEQKYRMQRNFLDYYNKNVFFLPGDKMPENWLASIHSNNNTTDVDGKQYFIDIAKTINFCDNPNSEEIFIQEKYVIDQLDPDRDELKTLREQIQQIVCAE
jgi:hypothetical protein